MTPGRRLFGVFLLILAVGACSFERRPDRGGLDEEAAPPVPDAAGEFTSALDLPEDSIRAAVAAYLVAVAVGDTAAARSALVPNAIGLIGPFASVVPLSHPATLADLRALLAAAPAGEALRPDGVLRPAGPGAAVWLTGTAPGPRISWTVARTAAGWRVAHLHRTRGSGAATGEDPGQPEGGNGAEGGGR